MPRPTAAQTRRLDDVAAHINAHLLRMEGDPVVNASQTRSNGLRLTPFFEPNAYRRGSRVMVRYTAGNPNTDSALELDEAERYLSWLDAGNNGKHTQVPS